MNDPSENTVSSTNDLSTETFKTVDLQLDDDNQDMITSSNIKLESQESNISNGKKTKNFTSSTNTGGRNKSYHHSVSDGKKVSSEKKKERKKTSLKVKWQMKIDTSSLSSSDALDVSSSNLVDKSNQLSDTEAKHLANDSQLNLSDKSFRANKRVIKRKSWIDEYEVTKFTPSKKSKGAIRPDCPPFCRTNCTLIHHPLLLAARKVIENDSATTMQFLQKVESFYGGADGQMKPSDPINDQWKNTSYPLLHYLALMGKCACSFALSQSGHEPTTTVTEAGDNVLHILVKDMYLFNCTHGHMDVLMKKFNLLLKEFVDCLKFVNKRKETPLHINAKLISDTVLLLKDESRQKPPFRLYQFCKSMFDACLVQLSSVDDAKRLINLQDHDGFTVSHYIASDRASYNFLDQLKELGANFEIKNNFNQSVTDIQAKAPSPPSEDLLELAVFSAKGNKIKNSSPNKPKYSPLPKRLKKKRSKSIEQELDTKTSTVKSISKPASLRIPLSLQKQTVKTTPGPRIKVTPVRSSKENKTGKREQSKNFPTQKNQENINGNSNDQFKKMINETLSDKNWKSIEGIQSNCVSDSASHSTSVSLSNENTENHKENIYKQSNIENKSDIFDPSTANISKPPITNRLKVCNSRFPNILPKSEKVKINEGFKTFDENSKNTTADLSSANISSSNFSTISSSIVSSKNNLLVLTSPSVFSNVNVSVCSNSQLLQTSNNVQNVSSHMQLPNGPHFQPTTNLSSNLPTPTFSNLSQNNVIVRTPNGKLVSVNLMPLNAPQQPSVSSNLVSPVSLITNQTRQRASLQASPTLTPQQPSAMHHALQQQILQKQNQLNLQQQQLLNQLQFNNPSFNNQSQHLAGNTIQNMIQPRPFFFMSPNGLRYMVPSTSSLSPGTFVSVSSSYPNTLSHQNVQSNWRPNLGREMPFNQSYNFSSTPQYQQNISSPQTHLMTPGVFNRPLLSNNNQNHHNILETLPSEHKLSQKNTIYLTSGDTHSKKLRSLEASINYIKNGSQKRKSNPSRHLPGLQMDTAPPPVIILDNDCPEVQNCTENRQLQSPSVESSQDSSRTSPHSNCHDTGKNDIGINFVLIYKKIITFVYYLGKNQFGMQCLGCTFWGFRVLSKGLNLYCFLVLNSQCDFLIFSYLF